MLTKTQLDEYRADYRIRNLVVLGIVTIISGCAALGIAMARSETFPSYAFLAIWLVAVLSSVILISLAIGTPFSQAWQRHKSHTRIGYQVVWMLDKDGHLDNRVEPRSHQDARDNTSAWVVYEPLGGHDRRMFIVMRDGAQPQYAVRMSYLRVTRSSECYVRVRDVQGVRGDQEMTLWTLLQVLNATGGHLGTNAYYVLMRRLADANNALAGKSVVVEGLLKTIEGHVRTIQSLNLSLGESEAMRARMMATLGRGVIDAQDALANINRLTQARGTRVKDIQTIASEALKSISRSQVEQLDSTPA
jgi:hypothetical protein